jgi:hypothetical protein
MSMIVRKITTGNRRSQEVVDEAETLGWKAEFTGGGHIKLSKLGKPAIFCGISPGDRKAAEIVRKKIRNAERGIITWRRDQSSGA